jgi:hypothetical protein
LGLPRPRYQKRSEFSCQKSFEREIIEYNMQLL